MKQGQISNRTWIAIIGLILIAALAGMVSMNNIGGKSSVAKVYQEGVLIREIDLNAVDDTYSFDVESPDGGVNTISVRPGGICVSEANCSDNTCVKQGWLEHGITPIVCLPHRLVIQLESMNADDRAQDTVFDAVVN